METTVRRTSTFGMNPRIRQHYYRTNIYPEQKEILKDFYKKNQFPDFKAKQILGQMIGLPPKVITTWYRNYRNRIEKKD